MHRVIRSTILVLVLASGPSLADGPNTLTPKEAAEGWLLLFDGVTTTGWAPRQGTNIKTWEIVARDGALVVASKGGGFIGIESTSRFRHFELLGEYKVGGRFAAPRADLGVPTVHEDPRVGNYLPATLPAAAEWMPFAVRVAPEEKRVTIGGKEVINWPTPTGPDKDRFVPVKVLSTVLRFTVPEKADCRLELRNLKLRPLALETLFNGKDLTSWTVFPDPKRQAAKFTVTPAGELHVLGGPGDLQTTAKYADFVLQTEVKTNGPMVNSGLFFRCVPGQYQNGYEVQIQNGFKDNDRTKPTDGGTGAIYRRFPARKVIPNDKEWFTLTVIASGPHLATWVNGYPTASWTDDRKPHENPRQGLRTTAGHLSIQGHNPPMSADVLFRNMRIAEVKSSIPPR